MDKLQINNSWVGGDAPSYIVAEMSANHCGDIDNAIALIHKAKECGADAIKLQTYKANTITLDSNCKDFLIPAGNPWKESETLFSLYEKAYTPWEWHEELFEIATKVGIDIFSSPFDETAVDFLEKLNCPAYKIASPEITHIPLLERVAKTGKPIIISTGVAEYDDLVLADKVLRENGCRQYVMLKCTSSYPAPFESINLRTMIDFEKQFKCLIGLSDHTLGTTVSVAAVAMGASFIEKHLVLDKEQDSVDAFFSLDGDEFKKLVSEIRIVEKARGSVKYSLGKEDRKNYWGRRSLYVSKDIRKGEVLNSSNIKCVRPGFGLHPRNYREILGKRAKRNLCHGDRLSFDDVE